MIQIYKKTLALVCYFLLLCGFQRAFAQNDDNPGALVDTVLIHSSDGIFSSTATFTFQLKSTFKYTEKGKASILVTTEAGKKVRSDSVSVNIASGESKDVEFSVGGLKPGFYKISFMADMAHYNDTARKAFGIKPDQISSQYGKPADFESFWHDARLQLDKVAPEYKLTELPDSAKGGHRRVFRVEMKSLDGYLIRGFLTEPISANKNKKFAVLLGLPGYQVALGPMLGNDPDFAIFTLNYRGSGYSRDVINVRREDYIVLNLENKDKYILRGAVMDCVRAVDFIYSRKELKHDNILAAGGSLGGFLAIATSGIDKRINFCSAANPILCDVRNLVNEVDWPFIDMRKYVNTRPGLTMEKVMDNLDYFDTKNFGTDIECPTLVGMGLVDPIAPPNTVYTLYNGIRAPKHLIIFRDLGHEIGKKYSIYEGRWMRDTFALF
jgi:cephalosporin-C deacetylase